MNALQSTTAHLLAMRSFAQTSEANRLTAELAAIILRDSAHIAESDAAYADARGYSKHQPALPLYDSGDAERAIDLLTTVEHDMESTYGDRLHEAEDDDVLAEAITRTVGRGGVVLMPAFAVDRTFVLLMILARLETEGRIPSVPVYVDSPMALRARGLQ